MKTSTLLLGLAALVFGGATRAAEPPRPNILYFYVDDMGWGSIGPNGQAERRAKGLPSVQTPNLDRLAAEGLNFTRGYGCHVCSPARSSQQSGFHQGHTFADRNDPNNAKKAMRADDVLMGDALSAAGYVTGYWGKWGYGGSKDQDNPTIENVQTLPTSHGYTHVLAELHHVRAHTFFQPTLWYAPASDGSVGGLELIPNSMAAYQNDASYPKTPALQNHRNYPKTAYCDDSYAFAALDFVRNQGQNYNQTGQPFFGLLAVQIPHAPFGEIESLPQWDAAYADDPHYASLAPQTRQWAAMVTRIDAHFGNILAALEDPNQDGDKSDSIADNTLVVFQSDNGGPGGKNLGELDANGGLRGTKGKIQEGGIRVPLVMRWPSKITSASSLKAGSNCEKVVDVTDLLPTFCELAGVRPPLGIDGVSIAPTLTGSGHQRHRSFLIHEAGNGQSIIQGNFKLVRTKKSLELYDLENDPAEQNDISKLHPQLVFDLKTLLLGERVDEPRGFANTYHHWTGKSGDGTASADHWSDYEYSNAGITYMEDRGTPQLSWVAKIANEGKERSTTNVDSDLFVLALEVSGTPQAPQVLQVDDAKVIGLNEVRLSAHSTLSIDGGAVTSLRWIDVLPDATLSGRGGIGGNLYNNGRVASASDEEMLLSVIGDYHQFADGELAVKWTGEHNHCFAVSGTANLAGNFRFDCPPDHLVKPGDKFIVLQAKQVSGKFANEGDEVTANGNRFEIQYSDTEVTLVAK